MAAEITNAPCGCERPRAPRVERAHTSMSAAALAISDPFKALSGLEMSGTRPLGDAGTVDGVITLLEQAEAITSVFGVAWDGCDQDAPFNISLLNPTIHARAMDGVSTLLALAAAYAKDLQS